MFCSNDFNHDEIKTLETVDFYSNEGIWTEIKSVHKFFESHLGVIDRKIQTILSIIAVFITLSGFILFNYIKIIEVSHLSLFFFADGIANLYFGILSSIMALRVRWISLALPSSSNHKKYDCYQDGCNPHDCISNILIVRKEKTFFLHASMWLLMIGIFGIIVSIFILIFGPK